MSDHTADDIDDHAGAPRPHVYCIAALSAFCAVAVVIGLICLAYRAGQAQPGRVDISLFPGLSGYVEESYREAKLSRAKIDAETISGRVEQYRLNNDTYPRSVEALAQQQPNGGRPLVALDKTRDPWGKLYQIDPRGPQNGGLKADVFTTSPEGQVIGNFSQ